MVNKITILSNVPIGYDREIMMKSILFILSLLSITICAEFSALEKINLAGMKSYCASYAGSKVTGPSYGIGTGATYSCEVTVGKTKRSLKSWTYGKYTGFLLETDTFAQSRDQIYYGNDGNIKKIEHSLNPGPELGENESSRVTTVCQFDEEGRGTKQNSDQCKKILADIKKEINGKEKEKSHCEEIHATYVICNGARYNLDKSAVNNLPREAGKVLNYKDESDRPSAQTSGATKQ